MTTAVTPVRLSEPMLVDGLASPRFFNGRLLSGEALTQSREAERAQRERLGRALGDGVVEGLRVSAAGNTRLAVGAGLCVNRDGATLHLPIDIEVSFESRGADGVARAAGAFADCTPAVPAGRQAVPGAYALIVGPAAGARGRAPVSAGGDVCCNVRDDIEGVQFRIAPVLAPSSLAITDATRRDRVAQLCFGTREAAVDGAAIDALPQCLAEEHRLTRAEVPLAVFHWADNRVSFVDLWPARRFVTPPTAEGDRWSDAVGGRHRALREAMFLQLQDHLRDVPALTAAANLSWLPPAGVLPSAAEARWRSFLGPMAPSYAVAVASPHDLRGALRRGLELDPIPVRANDPVPVDVYVHGNSAVFARSTRGRVRIRVRGADVEEHATLYAKARDPHRVGRTMRYQGWNAVERDDGDAHKVYTIDLDPGVYKLYTHRMAPLPAAFRDPVTIVGGRTLLIDVPRPA